MENNRINAIDIAKGIGIVLVIVGHALPSNNTIRYFVYTFHMPLFFMLAGMVMKSPEQEKNFFEDFFAEKNLIEKYCLYSVLYIIFDTVIRFLILRQMSLSGLFWDFYNTVVFYGINVLWFLATLILAKVLAKRICLISTAKVLWLVIGIVLFAICCMVSVHLQWLDNGKYRLILYPLIAVLRAVSVTVYVLLGHVMKGKIREYICNADIWTTVCSVIFAALFLRLLFRRAGYIDIHVMWMGNWPIAFVCAILGFIVVFGISILIDKVGVGRILFRYLGINSLFIMATHEYLNIKLIIDWLLQKLNLMDRQYTVLLQIVLLIAIECMFCKAIKRKELIHGN